jgi:hypothetical protein
MEPKFCSDKTFPNIICSSTVPKREYLQLYKYNITICVIQIWWFVCLHILEFKDHLMIKMIYIQYNSGPRFLERF